MPDYAAYRAHVELLIEAALAAADPATAVFRHLQRQNQTLLLDQNETFDLTQGRLFLVSVGKAALPMLDAAAAIVGEALAAGIAVTKVIPADYWPAHPAIRVYRGSHPVSDEESVQATTAVYHFLQQTQANDLVLCLISGGASALLTQPRISLADWQALNQALLASGCPIHDFNIVRRQLDAVKGGGLSRWAAPARTVSLILSDVVGNPLEFIGSGPTVPGADTPADALQVLRQYGIEERVETAVWRRISEQLTVNSEQWTVNRRGGSQTALFDDVLKNHFIIGDVRQAAAAALDKANELGFSTQLLTAHLEGEAREAGRLAAAIAKDAPPNHCFILGGETTVTLRGEGKGGRNLETALSAAAALDGWSHCAIASFATDGEDGPTDAAGAVVTGETAAHGRRHALNASEYLDHNDSYTYFQNLDEMKTAVATLLKTGPTGTNVNDLVIILTYTW
jgi:glycerate 2-kinase